MRRSGPCSAHRPLLTVLIVLRSRGEGVPVRSFPSPWKLSLSTHRTAAAHWLLENRSSDLVKFASFCLDYPVRPVIMNGARPAPAGESEKERQSREAIAKANNELYVNLIRFALLLVEKDRSLGRRIPISDGQEDRLLRHVKGVIQVLVLAQYDLQLEDDALRQTLARTAPAAAVQRFTKRALTLQQQIRVLTGKRLLDMDAAQLGAAVGGNLKPNNIKQIVNRTSRRLALISAVAWAHPYLSDEEFRYLHLWAGKTSLNPVLGCRTECARPDCVHGFSSGRFETLGRMYRAHNWEIADDRKWLRLVRARRLTLSKADIHLIRSIRKARLFRKWSYKVVPGQQCGGWSETERDCKLGDLIHIVWGEMRLKRWRRETGLSDVTELILGLEDGGFWPE